MYGFFFFFLQKFSPPHKFVVKLKSKDSISHFAEALHHAGTLLATLVVTSNQNGGHWANKLTTAFHFQFPRFSTSHQITDKILLILQYYTAAFHPLFEIPKTITSLPVLWPQSCESCQSTLSTMLDPFQLQFISLKPKMLLLCVSIFHGYVMPVQLEVSKVPRFCYRNLIILKEDGLLKSEDLNLKFCSPTDWPGNIGSYFSFIT